MGFAHKALMLTPPSEFGEVTSSMKRNGCQGTEKQWCTFTGLSRLGSPGRLRPAPQTTDTVVPKRPWSFLASSWARAMGMYRGLRTGLPRRPT
jgi:hypothetical protein